MNAEHYEYILNIYKNIASGLPVDFEDLDTEIIKATLERDRLVVSGIDTVEIDRYIAELEKIAYNDNFKNRN